MANLFGDVVPLLAIALMGTILLYLLIDDWRLLSGPRRRTRGAVIDHVKRTDDDSEYYVAKVRFSTDEGRQIVITDTYGGRSPKPPVGATLPIIYPLANPEGGRVHRTLVRVLVYAFVLGTLAVFGAIATGYL